MKSNIAEEVALRKEKIIDSAIGMIEKQFGKGSIMRLDESSLPITDVPSIPTGSISLDIALGIGGLPKGRIVEIFGPESSGKTTLSLHIIAEIQKKGGIAAFIDAEHALDLNYAKKLGINLSDLLIAQPDNGEEALEITDILVRSGSVDIVVIDSVAALVPRAELEGYMGDSHVGLQARLMSQALRKLTSAVYKSSTLVIFINQLRQKIGITFGNPETTTGGNALKFYSSIRLDIRKVNTIKVGEESIGNRTAVKVVKNKLYPPFKTVEFDLIYGEGISKESEILDLGILSNIVEKNGGWYSYNSLKLGQGKENAKSFLKENPKLLFELEGKILSNFNIERKNITSEDNQNNV